jgi:hypothetical protein
MQRPAHLPAKPGSLPSLTKSVTRSRLVSQKKLLLETSVGYSSSTIHNTELPCRFKSSSAARDAIGGWLLSRVWILLSFSVQVLVTGLDHPGPKRGNKTALSAASNHLHQMRES